MSDPIFENFLNQKMPEMFIKAEELFGSRDKDYKILGYTFVPNGQCIFHLDPEDQKQILIYLPQYAYNDYNQSLYMLSHEVFHCLGPKRGLAATILEEGLATYFARFYMNYLNLGPAWESSGKNYNDAMADVYLLLNLDKDIIKKARIIQPTTSLITKDLLSNLLGNSIDNYLLDRLVSDFV